MRTFGKLAVASVAVGLAASALAPSPVSAQGSPYTKSCPSGSALVGLDGWQGWWMDGVRAVCQPVNVTTGAVSGTRWSSSVAGTAKGSTLQARCPAGHVLTGFTGSRGNYVTTIHSIRCSPIGAGGMAESNGVWVNAFPKKSSSGTFLANDCSGGRVATGINGRAATYVDYFNIGCALLPGATEQVATQASTTTTTTRFRTTMTLADRSAMARPGTVTLVSPAGGTQIRGHQASDPCAKVDVLPPFRWQAATNAARYELELRNVTRSRTRTFRNTGTSQYSTRLMLIAGDSYSWRVRAVNGIGVAGSWSAARGIQAVAGAASGGTACVVGPGAYPTF